MGKEEQGQEKGLAGWQDGLVRKTAYLLIDLHCGQKHIDPVF